MRLGAIGATLCVVGGLCMIAGLAVDLDSTAAKVLIAVAAALFVPGSLLTYVWLRMRMGDPR
jgi:hypothetical protein